MRLGSEPVSGERGVVHEIEDEKLGRWGLVAGAEVGWAGEEGRGWETTVLSRAAALAARSAGADGFAGRTISARTSTIGKGTAFRTEWHACAGATRAVFRATGAASGRRRAAKRAAVGACAGAAIGPVIGWAVGCAFGGAFGSAIWSTIWSIHWIAGASFIGTIRREGRMIGTVATGGTIAAGRREWRVVGTFAGERTIGSAVGAIIWPAIGAAIGTINWSTIGLILVAIIR